MLNDKYKNRNIELFDCLIDDSLNFLKNDAEYYYIDFYLSLLYNTYMGQKIIELLSLFDLKKIKLAEEINIEYISPILDLLKGSPELITKHLKEN